jgi:hypothetical protein
VKNEIISILLYGEFATTAEAFHSATEVEHKSVYGYLGFARIARESHYVSVGESEVALHKIFKVMEDFLEEFASFMWGRLRFREWRLRVENSTELVIRFFQPAQLGPPVDADYSERSAWSQDAGGRFRRHGDRHTLLSIGLNCKKCFKRLRRLPSTGDVCWNPFFSRPKFFVNHGFHTAT